MLKLIYLFVILHSDNNCDCDELAKVETALGSLQGFWKNSLYGRKYAAFEGIPYAQPPVGNLRFEEPKPVTPWSGIWIANTTQTCIQTDHMEEVQGEEDCLYLNVYIPAEFLEINSKKLDVLVVIHGGSFTVGSAHEMVKSQWLMDRDIVLVSINYRLGILGFLSTEDEAIPGNNGMKDQVLALKWVKDNIESFGGNPRSVTIAGQSAGGASVHLHYFSPLSRGLFKGGLSQSGSALSPIVIKKKSLGNAKRLARLVGCRDTTTNEIKACLKQRPAPNLIKQLKHFINFFTLIPFAVVVEKGSKSPFLEKHPYLLLKQGEVLDVPWITSHTADEGLLVTASYYTKLDEIDQKWNKISHNLLKYDNTQRGLETGEVSEEILNYYLGSQQRINSKNFRKFTKIFGDRIIATPAEVAAKMQAKVTKSPVYYYYFNYDEGENQAKQLFSNISEIQGVAHGEDAIYFYGICSEQAYSEQDKLLHYACQSMLYSFCSTGKPSFDGTDRWQPTRSETLTYLNVTGPNNMKLQSTKNLTPIPFWSRLEATENEDVKDEF